MTAGVEVVCGEVARKVEIEVNSSDLSVGGGGVTVDCDVGGGGSGNGGGDSACVFVNGGVEVSDDDPGDTGDVSVDGVDRFKEEGLGLGNEGVVVDPLVSESDVKGVNGDVYIENGSTVEPPVNLVANGVEVDVYGHLDKVSGEQEADAKSTEEVDGLTESTQSTIESSEVAVSELEAANVDELAQFKKEELGFETEGIQVESLVSESNGLVYESTTVSAAEVKAVKDNVNLVNGSTVDLPVVLMTNGAGVDVNGHLDKISGEQDGDVKSIEKVDGLTESTQNTIESSEVTVSELEAAIKLSDVAVSTADCEVMVNDGPDSIGCLVDNQACPVSVDESETSLNDAKKVESDTIVTELDGKLEEQQELLVITSEVNVEAENKNSKEDDALANGQVEKFDRILEMGETEISGTEADESSEKLVKVTESVEMEVKVEDEILESQTVVIDNESLSNSDDSTDVLHLVPEIRSPEVLDCKTQVENVVYDNEEKGIKVNDALIGDHSTLTFSDTIVNHGVEIEFGSIGRHKSTPSIQNKEVEGMNGIQSDEIPNSSIEGEEVNDAIDAQNDEIEVLEYNFLVKIPRFEDENLRDQIRSAHALVVEKTHLRDSIRVAGQEKRERLRVYNEEFEAEKKKEIAARRVVKAKRQEIEAVQAVINRWKNAMTVEDIDSRIFGVEYMIQHETIQLKDEKEFIREIRQLKSLRDQLASNMGTPEEIRHAIDTKDHNEKRLKVLRKELEELKAEVSKIVAGIQKIMRKYEELIREEKEMQYRFRAADESRQKAYAHLNSLRKLLYDKNTNFRQFKEDLTKAKTYLSQGDKDSLHRLCANQVETFMEQWNTNNEFRQEYIRRSNCIASRKQKALDAAPPVPDDVAPMPPSIMIEKVDTSPSPVSLPSEVKHVAVVLPVEQEKDALVSPNETLRNKRVVKPTNLGSADVAKDEADMADDILTKEEIELARKAEELKKEEIAKLKEQRRLEEKAKAVEALERKKRNAEKAQLRAELRARKEAEQKEKEREKRLRKKEKKTDEIIEEAAGSENEGTSKDTETAANKKKPKKPPAHFFSQQARPRPVPVPPQVLNRNRRRWQQAGRIALVAVAVVVVFLLANFGLFLGFKPAKFKYMRF